MAASGMQLVDIKALLERARASLPVGRLIATDTFNLFEAMSALEVGNAKMDPTSQPPGQTLEQLLESGAAPLYLSPVQLLSVMDQLLCLEATWHTGASAAQTVFASLYMLTPERTSAGNAVLGAYCGALLATCREVRDTVHAGCVCDEEDFNTNTQGLPIDDIGACMMRLRTPRIAFFPRWVQGRGTLVMCNCHCAADIAVAVQRVSQGSGACHPHFFAMYT